MSSIKWWVAGMWAGAVACGSSGAVAQTATPTLVVSQQVQDVQTPGTAGQAGISYVADQGGDAAVLKVYTQGFLFCGNPGENYDSPATLLIAHEDQSFANPHPWTFSNITDAPVVSYSGGTLKINPVTPTSLTCLGTGISGSTTTALSEGIFDNSFDSATEENYNHLVNWIPPQGFDWFDPDWSEVPSDACDLSPNQSPQVSEDVDCAAVTGVSSNDNEPVRAPVMWTAADNTNFTFTYLFRVDLRAGAQVNGMSTVFQAPTSAEPMGDVNPAFPNVVIQDAFEGGDAGQIGYLGSSAHYCTLNAFPTVPLSSAVCSGQGVGISDDVDGTLNLRITAGALPVGSGVDQAFYVAVTRPIVGNHPNLTTPIVAATVLTERGIVDEGGDRFTGDNIVFGFMPNSQGFPWMYGQ